MEYLSNEFLESKGWVISTLKEEDNLAPDDYYTASKGDVQITNLVTFRREEFKTVHFMTIRDVNTKSGKPQTLFQGVINNEEDFDHIERILELNGKRSVTYANGNH